MAFPDPRWLDRSLRRVLPELAVLAHRLCQRGFDVVSIGLSPVCSINRIVAAPTVRGLPDVPRVTWHHVQHEPSGRLLREGGDGSLFLDLKREEAEHFWARATRSVEVSYDQRRLHSTFCKISPAAFEQNAAA